MTAEAVKKGQWFLLPNGKVAQVCSLATVRAPMQDGDRAPRLVVEVTIRFLNTDGAMAPGELVLAESFIAKHCKRVHVAPVAAIKT